MKKIVGLTILLILYLACLINQWEAWSNILSPLNALAASGVLYYAYYKSDRRVRGSITLLLYACACTAWVIADTIWAVIYFTGGVPGDSPLVWVIYVVTNCFLVASLTIFAVHQFSRWFLFQTLIDLLISGFLTVGVFWILFLHKDVYTLKTLLASDFTSILSLLTDILICTCIFLWFLSVRSGKIPFFIVAISIGLIMFAVVDMAYYYVEYNDLPYVDAVNFGYIVSFHIIAFGAIWNIHHKADKFDMSVVSNLGGRIRWVVLLLYPFVAVMLIVTGLVNTRLTVLDFFDFTVPILIYWIFCKYIKVSLEKEALLKQQNERLEQRIAAQVSELAYLADRDALTTLYNRTYFISCLENTLRSKARSEILAIVLIDLDRFKAINDTYGHDVGDKILIELSNRLTAWNNYGATVARLGGDEFAFMFAGKYTQRDIEDFCRQIIDLCNKPINTDNSSLYVTMSVGIALISEDVPDEKTLMRHADIAMYSAKSQGYNKYQFYNPIIDQNFKRNVAVEALLRKAEIEKDFQLYYQPQYSLPDMKLIGAEALLRWEEKEHGFIPPSVFIPIAEEIEYINKIGRWVIQESVSRAKLWNSRSLMQLKVGINISPKQFGDTGFMHLLESQVAAGELDPAWIDMEITESVMIQDNDYVEGIFTLMKSLGVSVSIDDFGSGYSGLSYLNKYPFDRIKLDKSLIDNISLFNESGINIVKAAINMAHAVGIRTIAEGVESKEQLDILIGLGCDQVQGYLFGRPVPADLFEQRYIKKKTMPGKKRVM